MRADTCRGIAKHDTRATDVDTVAIYDEALVGAAHDTAFLPEETAAGMGNASSRVKDWRASRQFTGRSRETARVTKISSAFAGRCRSTREFAGCPRHESPEMPRPNSAGIQAAGRKLVLQAKGECHG